MMLWTGMLTTTLRGPARGGILRGARAGGKALDDR
jgi:hypothetical protein